MAEPIFPICDLLHPGRDPEAECQVHVQAEMAVAEERLGNFRQAMDWRILVLRSPHCRGEFRDWLLEELVRDCFCLEQPHLAAQWIEQLAPPLRCLYGAALDPCGQSVSPVEADTQFAHRHYYWGLGCCDSLQRRKAWSQFLCQDRQIDLRSWEVEEARLGASLLCRRQRVPYCVMCCRTAEDGSALVECWGKGCLCADCALNASLSMTISLHNSAPRGLDVDKLHRMTMALKQSGFPHKPRVSKETIPPPPAWAAEGLQCLERGRSASAPPWTSLDLLSATVAQLDPPLAWANSLSQPGIKVHHQPEEISSDGCHSLAWLRALEIAEWLCRWRAVKAAVQPLDLLSGLYWSGPGLASIALQARAESETLSRSFWGVGSLPASEVHRLQKELADRPDDFFLHCVLLRQHWAASSPIAVDFRHHAIWMLRQHPRHPMTASLIALVGPLFDLERGLEQAGLKRELLALVQALPADPQTLQLVADYHRERPTLRLALLRRAAALACSDFKIASALSEALVRLGHWEEAVKVATASMQWIPRHKHDGPLRQILEAQVCLECWTQVEQTARRLLQFGGLRNQGESRMALGQVALVGGNPEEAEKQLLLGGRFQVWDTRLMHRLLLQGRSQAVLDYLSLLLNGGKYEHRRRILRAWMRRIRSGRMPDYGVYR